MEMEKAERQAQERADREQRQQEESLKAWKKQQEVISSFEVQRAKQLQEERKSRSKSLFVSPSFECCVYVSY